MADTPIDGKPNLPIGNITGTERLPVSAGTDTGGIGPGATDRKITFDTFKGWVENNFEGIFDAIIFNTDPPVLTDAGTILWNKTEYTIDVNTGLGATIQVGQEVLMLYHNDTGIPIINGQVLHPKGAVTLSGVQIPTPELAIANDWAKCEGTLSVATHDIANGALGFATRFGKVRELNTSGFTPGQTMWLSAITAGLLSPNKPSFPNYSISMGGALNSETAPDGQVFISVTKSVEDTFNDAWDGAVRETFDFLVTSDGGTVTGTLTNTNPLLKLTLIFSDVGFYTLDTVTAPVTIELTPGTDSATITNYVYIPASTKVLTLSTGDWPTDEHCKIAQLEVQSAATVLSEDGAERNQNVNNHVKLEGDNGHIIHLGDWIRDQNATWKSGTEGSLTGTPANGYIQVTSGKVRQTHLQVVEEFSMPTRDIIIRNDFTTPNRRTDNLNTIDAYSDGSSWNNEWSKVVVWGIANKTGETDFYKLNLPSDGYNSEASAISDALNYADYTIPERDKGVGFLVGAFTVRISGGTITFNGGTAYQNLRGFVPNNIAGGGGGSGVTTYLGLTDTPSTRVGKNGYEIIVNESSNIDEYVEKKLAGTGIANGGISNTAQAIEGKKDFTSGVSITRVSNKDQLTLERTGTSTGKVQLFAFDGTFIISSDASSAANDLFTVGISTGIVYINKTPPLDATYNNTLTWNPSTKAVEQRESAYEALTPGAAVAYDLLTGLNKTLNVAEDSTITFSNPINGMSTGDIRLNVTVQSDVILAGAGVTFSGVGTLTALPIGVYHLAFVVISATQIDYNIDSSNPYV